MHLKLGLSLLSMCKREQWQSKSQKRSHQWGTSLVFPSCPQGATCNHCPSASNTLPQHLHFWGCRSLHVFWSTWLSTHLFPIRSTDENPSTSFIKISLWLGQRIVQGQHSWCFVSPAEQVLTWMETISSLGFKLKSC